MQIQDCGLGCFWQGWQRHGCCWAGRASARGCDTQAFHQNTRLCSVVVASRTSQTSGLFCLGQRRSAWLELNILDWTSVPYPEPPAPRYCLTHHPTHCMERAGLWFYKYLPRFLPHKLQGHLHTPLRTIIKTTLLLFP